MGRITVAAGCNGAGKSTLLAPFIRAAGGAYYDPDRYAQALRAAGLDARHANVAAWHRGFAALTAAIDGDSDFVFETTLGGQRITAELLRALARGRQVVILYVGLDSADLHVRRVAERVARGGHDIPEALIRSRYDASRRNLLRFVGTAATLRVWDNSAQSPDGTPRARLLLDIRAGRLHLPAGSEIAVLPAWIRPLAAAALAAEAR
ncbi:MAG TPA: zeta toxin family protein [Nevskiaceae bacterium]